MIAVLAVLMAAGMNASAQAGVEVGYVNMNYRISGGNVQSNPSLNGFYVGVSDEINLVAGLSIHIGLNYSYATDKSAKSIFQNLSLKGGSESDHYLNVPLRLRYSFNVIPKVLKIQAFAGPVFSVGLSHTQRFDYKVSIMDKNLDGTLKYNYYTGKFKSDAFSDEELASLNEQMPAAYKRFDVGLGGGVGIELLRLIEVKVGYDWGLMNRFKGNFADEMTCNRNLLYVTLGLRF